MAYSDKLRTVGRVTGAAATTAPYVRRLATDEELRGDVADFIRSANTLVEHLRSDKRLRNDLRHMIESAQNSADHIRGDVRPQHTLRNLVVGAGLLMTAAIGIAIALVWPRTRQSMRHVADQTASRASATVRDVREKISGQSGAQAA